MTHRSWSADQTRSPLALFSALRMGACVACHNRATSACGAPSRTSAGCARCARRSSACAVPLWHSTPSRPSLDKSRSSPASWPRCRGRRPSSSSVMRAPRLPSSPAMSAPAPDAGTGSVSLSEEDGRTSLLPAMPTMTSSWRQLQRLLASEKPCSRSVVRLLQVWLLDLWCCCGKWCCGWTAHAAPRRGRNNGIDCQTASWHDSPLDSR